MYNTHAMKLGEKGLISLYYQALDQAIRNRLSEEEDQYIAKVDTQEFTDFLYSEYALPLLEIDPQHLAETKRITGGQEYTDFDGDQYVAEQNQVQITIFFTLGKNLELALLLEANEREMRTLEVEFDEENAAITFTTTPSGLQGEINYINGLIKRRNPHITQGNVELKAKLPALIDERKKKVSSFEQEFQDALAKISIPLKRIDILQSPLVDLKVRKNITELRKPIVSPLNEFILDEKYVGEIIDVIQRSGMEFELYPDVFGKKLEEEDLRGIILAHLNTIFYGNATGESFSKQGKTDIFLRIQQGQILVSECKFWGGEKLYQETIDQLFRYLTWRMNYGIIITFAKNQGFSDVLSSIEQATTKHPSYESGFTTVKKTHFRSIHTFPSDSKKKVVINHLAFNLFSN